MITKSRDFHGEFHVDFSPLIPHTGYMDEDEYIYNVPRAELYSCIAGSGDDALWAARISAGHARLVKTTTVDHPSGTVILNHYTWH